MMVYVVYEQASMAARVVHGAYASRADALEAASARWRFMEQLEVQAPAFPGETSPHQCCEHCHGYAGCPLRVL